MLILFGFYPQILPWNTIKSWRLQNMQNRAQKVLFDWNFCSKTLLVCFLSVLETFRSRDRDVKSWDKKQYTLMARICSFPAVWPAHRTVKPHRPRCLPTNFSHNYYVKICRLFFVDHCIAKSFSVGAFFEAEKNSLFGRQVNKLTRGPV